MATAKRQRRLRIALTSVVIAALLFFILGYGAVKFGWLKEDPYLMIATIVGGAASLVGLLSLSRPSISADDLENLELEALGRVSNLAKELEDAKRAQAETRDEIEQLEVQRKQMEVSVRKAATVLFLREKITRQQERLSEKLQADRELAGLVLNLKNDYEQLGAVGEEITQDPNVELLSDVIMRLRPERDQVTLLESVMELAGQLLGKIVR
jgi:chromosome segregation ATPase